MGVDERQRVVIFKRWMAHHAGIQSGPQRIQIERKFAEDLPRVWGNEGQLQRAFLNILMNSETAMPEGGRLILSSEQEGGWVVLRVSDSGRGIPAENLERVFEPFFTTKDDWKGAGLGLSVVYQIVKDHGGEVSIQSKEGEGTVVTMRPIHDNWHCSVVGDGAGMLGRIFVRHGINIYRR